MNNIIKRILLLTTICIILVGMIPKLFAYTSEIITLDIKVITPDGINHQSTVPTNIGQYISLDTTTLYTDYEYVYAIYNGDTYLDTTITFTASRSTSVTLIYKLPNQVTLTYLDTNDDIIDVIYCPLDNIDLTTPEVELTKPGHEFIGWDIPEVIEEDVIIHPVYNAINLSDIEINVNGITSYHTFNEVVTVSATSSNFSYWADEHGQVVSYEPNYKFSALTNRTLNEVVDENIDDTPLIYLSNVTGIRKDHISLLGYIENINKKIIEYGMLASSNKALLNLNNAIRIPSQSLSPTNEYLRTIAGDSYNTFRAYAILEGGQVIYSENNFVIELSKSYSEAFNNTGLSSSFSDRGFNGVDNTEWTIGQSRNAGDYSINGEGIMLRRASDSYIEIDFPNGLDTLSFDYRKAFTSSDNRQIEVLVNGITIHTTSTFGGFSGADDTVYHLSLTDLNLGPNTTIKIKLTGSSSTNRHVTIDNFKWTKKVEPPVMERLHEVTFNYFNEQRKVAVYSGSHVTEPFIEPLDTHSFSGWYLSPNFEGDAFDIEAPIEKSVTLYAKWDYIGIKEETLMYHIDFGSQSIGGYKSVDPITFTNNWDTKLYDLNSLRFAIEVNGTGAFGVLAPIKSATTAYIEFDLSNLPNTAHQISFDYAAITDTALNNLLNNNRDPYLVLEVFNEGVWEPLENIDGVVNIASNLTDTLQEVTYEVDGGLFYRIVLQTPGDGTTTLVKQQAVIVDNFKVIHHQIPPVFVETHTNTYYAEVGKEFDAPVLYALDRYGRYIEADLLSTYDLSTLGSYDLLYEAIDSDGLSTTHTVTLEVIEQIPIGDLPEMDEEVLAPLKAEFETERNKLPEQLNLPYSPETYYAGLNGLSGEAFKLALQNILVSTHIRPISYNEARFVLEQSDAINHTSGGVYLSGIYSNHNIVRYWDGGKTWAREHVWPNSKLGLPRVSGSNRDLRSDVHNLRVINPSVNSSRSNRYFNIGTTGFNETVGPYAYDPGIDHRGDVARIILYMYVRYNDVLDLSSIESEILAGQNYEASGTTFGLLDVLIAWHHEDPVDMFEINRNNVIYQYQGNRNPFIDKPEYVTRLFS